MARGRTLDGVASQLVNTATSFATVFAGSVLLSPHDFGRFALAFAIVTVLLGTARGVLGGPVLALLPRLDGDEARSVGHAALWFSGVCGLAGLLVTAVGSSVVPLLLVLAPGVLLAVVHDACRFVSLATHRARHALVLDALWLGTGALVVGAWWLAHGSVGPVALSLGWASGAAAGVAWHVVTDRPRPTRPTLYWQHTRRFVGWFAAMSALGQAETYATVFLAAALLDPTVVGGLRAVQLLALQPIVALGAAVVVALTPHAVRLVRDHPDDPLRQVVRMTARWSVALALTAVVVAVLRAPLMELLLPRFADDYTDLVLPIAAQTALNALVLPALVAWRSVIAARAESVALLVRGVATVAVSWPFLADGRVLAACWAVAGVHLVVVAGTWIAVVTTVRRRSPAADATA